jgi:hypothetical protein
MGGVIISPNVKKVSERIDPAGNIINPRTKQVIESVQPEYVEPVGEVTIATPLPHSPAVTVETPPTSKIDEMINKKIEEIVAKKIEEALSKL